MDCAHYSKERDDKSKLNDELTDDIICKQFNIQSDELKKTDGTMEDFDGIDRILPNGETIQKKNCECYSVNPKFSETVTIPCKNYHEYVSSSNVDWVFHSYYNRGEETKVKQWVLIQFSELKKLFDSKRKRKNHKTGTYFYYWPYKHGYISNQGEEICILDHAKSYSIP